MQQIVSCPLSSIAEIKNLFTLAITSIPFDAACILIIRYDTELNKSISCASNEYKTFKGFPCSLFKQADVCSISLHLLFKRITKYSWPKSLWFNSINNYVPSSMTLLPLEESEPKCFSFLFSVLSLWLPFHSAPQTFAFHCASNLRMHMCYIHFLLFFPSTCNHCWTPSVKRRKEIYNSE